MATKNESVAENLLNYPHKHLQKAIENAAKLGFNTGAALYPMITMNGEGCHNEWEITTEEILRNAAIAYAIEISNIKKGEPIPVNQFSDLVTQTYKSSNFLEDFSNDLKLLLTS